MQSSETDKMFWIENTDDNKSFVLFSQVSLKDYEDELNEKGGMFLDKIRSKNTGDSREGWLFPISERAAIDEFIEHETNDIKSTHSESLTVDDLYDILLEAFDRIATLEKQVEKLIKD